MPDEIDRKIDEFLCWFKEYGTDFLEDMKKLGIDENRTRIHLRLMFDEELHKKVFGVTIMERYLMEEDHLTLEEAQYVIKHPCLEDAEDNCSYHKEYGKCVLFGCTFLNGWLYHKTTPDGKLRPNYRAWEKLPKDTLYIGAKDTIKDGTLKKKVEEFLEEP